MSEEAIEDVVEEVVENVEANDETVAEPEAEQTDVETAESEGEETAEKEEKPSESSTEKPKKGVQKRIDELTGTIRQERELRVKAEQDAEYLRQMAEQGKSAPLEPGKTLADFDYDEAKFTQYIVDQAKSEATKSVQHETEVQTQIRKRVAFNAKEADYAKDHEDYMIKTRNGGLKITPHMLAVMEDSDNGPEIFYHLANNEQLASKVSMLPPLVQARELGKIEAKLTTPVVKPVTEAPKPAKTLKGANQKVSKSLADMNQKEFEAHRRKTIANR